MILIQKVFFLSSHDEGASSRDTSFDALFSNNDAKRDHVTASTSHSCRAMRTSTFPNMSTSKTRLLS